MQSLWLLQELATPPAAEAVETVAAAPSGQVSRADAEGKAA